jgi:CheY-like chemotaxis protein/HPt (histidine-containing phosphotransfer) domain-containing protein
VYVQEALVIDDDEVSRELLLLFVAEAGFEGISASSGDDALAMVKAMPIKPGTILADMQMDGITGNALALELRALCGSGTRLIAMSGTEVAAEKTAAFDGFLLKPISLETLRAALEGDHAQPQNRTPVELEPLNEATFASLARSMPTEQLVKLYVMCVDDAERRIGTMREAVAEDDAAGYERAAHAIKGGCGMVGATELATLASAMEQNGIAFGGDVEPLERFLVASARLRRMLDARVV